MNRKAKILDSRGIDPLYSLAIWVTIRKSLVSPPDFQASHPSVSSRLSQPTISHLQMYFNLYLPAKTNVILLNYVCYKCLNIQSFRFWYCCQDTLGAGTVSRISFYFLDWKLSGGGMQTHEIVSGWVEPRVTRDSVLCVGSGRGCREWGGGHIGAELPAASAEFSPVQLQEDMTKHISRADMPKSSRRGWPQRMMWFWETLMGISLPVFLLTEWKEVMNGGLHMQTRES